MRDRIYQIIIVSLIISLLGCSERVVRLTDRLRLQKIEMS